jgi:5-methylthioadenosine/S-adenosylhomocysteine deaminase
MATLGGAEVLGIEDRTGSLTPGKEADIIVLDPRRANFYPVLDPLSQIVFSGEPENVAYVFVAGKLLKDAGMVQYSDVHGLLQATQRAAERIRPWIRTGERAQDDSRKLADGK